MTDRDEQRADGRAAKNDQRNRRRRRPAAEASRRNHRAETREPREPFDTTPSFLPPGPATGGAESGGEPAASRRHVQSPSETAHPRKPAGQTDLPEPFLGYDGLDMDGVLDWIREADPDTRQLRRLVAYERRNRDRDTIIQACTAQLHRLSR